MQSEKVLGYELLARSNITGLENPGLMFSAAAKLDQECSLSRLVRTEGVKEPQKLASLPLLFVNTHPKEVVNDDLIESLYELRRQAPRLPIVLEIHEGAVSDLASIRKLRDILTTLDMKLAYDDFGAGQARIEELTEVPPDVLKFDMKLIRDIDTASSRRVEMVAFAGQNREDARDHHTGRGRGNPQRARSLQAAGVRTRTRVLLRSPFANLRLTIQSNLGT